MLRIKLFFIFFITLTAVLYSSATENTLYLKQANAFYKNRQYQDARHIYLQLLEKGITNSVLYYNLANACLKFYTESENTTDKEGFLGRAVCYYHRALKYKPGDKDTLYNLDYAQSLRGDSRSELNQPNPVLKTVLFFHYFPDRQTQLNLAALLLLVGLTLIFGFTFLRWKYRRALLKSAGICLLLYLVLSLSAFFKYRRQTETDRAVIIKTVCEAKTGPGFNQQTAFKVREGEVLYINRLDQEWYNIRLENGFSGWIAAADLMKI